MANRGTPARRFTDQAGDIETVIGEGTRVEGEIHGTTSMELWGTVEGKVKIDGLCWIRETGRLVGEVTAANVVVEGRLQGKITASQKVELRATCHVEGNIATRALAVAEGGYVEGHVQMQGSGEGGGLRQVTFQEKRKPQGEG